MLITEGPEVVTSSHDMAWRKPLQSCQCQRQLPETCQRVAAWLLDLGYCVAFWLFEFFIFYFLFSLQLPGTRCTVVQAVRAFCFIRFKRPLDFSGHTLLTSLMIRSDLMLTLPPVASCHCYCWMLCYHVGIDCRKFALE